MTYTLNVTSVEGLLLGIPTGQPGCNGCNVPNLSLTVPDWVALSGVGVGFDFEGNGGSGSTSAVSPNGAILTLFGDGGYTGGMFSGVGSISGEFSIQHGELSGDFHQFGESEGFDFSVVDGTASGSFATDDENGCSTDGHGGPVNTCAFQGTFEPDRLLVPEPASMSLLGAGLLLLGATRHRRRR